MNGGGSDAGGGSCGEREWWRVRGREGWEWWEIVGSNGGRGAMEGGNGGRGNDRGRGNDGGRERGSTGAHSPGRRRFISSLSMGGRCVRGRSSFMGECCHPGVGHRRCLLVGRRPHALEGCTGGGACRLSWFQHDGLSVVVGVRMGGGSLSLPVGACRSWFRGWEIIVVGWVSLSVGGSLSVCASGRCWWWRSSPVVAVKQCWQGVLAWQW